MGVRAAARRPVAIARGAPTNVALLALFDVAFLTGWLAFAFATSPARWSLVLHATGGFAILALLFFQAEDGIRGWSVTGVQTCALPICRVPEVARERDEVDERDEDRDPRRRERGAQHPERGCPDRARQGPDAVVGAGRGDGGTARPVGGEAEALGVAPHHLSHEVHEDEDPDAEDDVCRPPADRGHQELGQRRQREGADARAARGEADGETAPGDEPLHDRRVARHVRRAHAERSHEAVENVWLPQLGDERHAGERHAQEKPAGGDHDPRAPEVGEPPGGEADDAVGEGVDGKRAREARAAPAELPEERVEEDPERVLGAVGDEEDEERASDDDPAVEDAHGQARPFLPLSFGSTSARNLPVYEPGV